jgi:hypothetical protein
MLLMLTKTVMITLVFTTFYMDPDFVMEFYNIAFRGVKGDKSKEIHIFKNTKKLYKKATI